MLPPFIIDQIRKREEEELRKSDERPVLEIPMPYAPEPRRRPQSEEEPKDRGVVVIDLLG